MTDNPAEKIELELAEGNPWYWFILKTTRLDKKNDNIHGWSWFWGLHHLHHKLNNLPKFDAAKIQNFVPDKHWLKQTNISNVPANQADLHALVTKLIVLLEKPGKSSEIDKINITKNLVMKADFSNLIFPVEVFFESAIFSYDVNFSNALFMESVYLDDMTFAKTVNFKNAVFCGETSRFAGTDFEQTADFTDARFKGYANFKNSNFKGRTSFQRAKFELHAPRFYNAKFNNEMTFSGMKPSKLKKDEIDEYPDFNKKKDKIKDAYEIDENYRKRIEENQTSYENTSTKLGNQKKYHDEHLFFRNEMYCRQQLEKRWLAWFSYWLYQILSDYGYAMGRALGFWVGHIIVGALILFLIRFLNCIDDFFHDLGCAFAVSLANSHSFLFMKTRLTECYDVFDKLPFFTAIWVIQTILGILFLFLLLTTLRVRFRFSGITLGNTK